MLYVTFYKKKINDIVPMSVKGRVCELIFNSQTGTYKLKEIKFILIKSNFIQQGSFRIDLCFQLNGKTFSRVENFF